MPQLGGDNNGQTHFRYLGPLKQEEINMFNSKLNHPMHFLFPKRWEKWSRTGVWGWVTVVCLKGDGWGFTDSWVAVCSDVYIYTVGGDSSLIEADGVLFGGVGGLFPGRSITCQAPTDTHFNLPSLKPLCLIRTATRSQKADNAWIWLLFMVHFN